MGESSVVMAMVNIFNLLAALHVVHSWCNQEDMGRLLEMFLTNETRALV